MISMFNLVSKYAPSGDQPEAIKTLVEGIKEGKKEQVLLGATGTGKTVTLKVLAESFSDAGVPVFKTNAAIKPDMQLWTPISSIYQCWSFKVGIKYMFN